MITDVPAVLLVEDNPDDEELTLRGLRHANLTNPVDVARDGQEALDYLFGNHDQAAKPVPVVVLLDLHLPRVDGFEVLQRIRAEDRTHRVPVVILTSSSEDQDLIYGYDFGANSYVRKPVQFEECATVIAQLGIYWLRINDQPRQTDHDITKRRRRRLRRAGARVEDHASIVAGSDAAGNADFRAAGERKCSASNEQPSAGSAQQRPPSPRVAVFL